MVCQVTSPSSKYFSIQSSLYWHPVFTLFSIKRTTLDIHNLRLNPLLPTPKKETINSKTALLLIIPTVD
jgi:hypothetical protein